MEKHPLTHARQVNAFFPVIFAVVNRFNGEVIVDRFNGPPKGNAMVAQVRGSLVIIPNKLYRLEYRLSVVVSSGQYTKRHETDHLYVKNPILE